MANPTDKSSFLIHEFGSFEIKPNRVYKMIKFYTPFVRGKDRDSYIDHYRLLLKAWKVSWRAQLKKKSHVKKTFHFAKEIK